jgi:hypothetical protein
MGLSRNPLGKVFFFAMVFFVVIGLEEKSGGCFAYRLRSDIRHIRPYVHFTKK